MIKGGCFCQKIRYELDDGDYEVVNCHCAMCRKTSAAPFVTWLVVPRSAFRFTQGTVNVLQSSQRGQRQFCSQCGTPLVFTDQNRSATLDVTTGSLDAPNLFVPTQAVHEDSKLTWLGITEPD